MSHLAFMVGSRVYGAPREDSDLDLVVRMTPDVAYELYKFAGQPMDGPLHFGKLNIIPALDQDQWEAWENGLLKVEMERNDTGKPVPMERAREIFRSFPAIHGSPSSPAPGLDVDAAISDAETEAGDDDIPF